MMSVERIAYLVICRLDSGKHSDSSYTEDEIRHAIEDVYSFFFIDEVEVNKEMVFRQIARLVQMRDSVEEYGVLLLDHGTPHDKEWYSRWLATRPTERFWSRYCNYLVDSEYELTSLEAMDKDLKSIMGTLGDPNSVSGWADGRRGLVIGDIQSGKTGTYIGLIAKAIDAGYRCFIILTGNDSELRKQTQERVERGLSGIPTGEGWQDRSDTCSVKRFGPEDSEWNPIFLTTMNDDLSGRAVNLNADRIEDMITENKPNGVYIAVMKKTPRFMEGLKKRIDERRKGRDIKLPLLFIDDEADYASINTRKAIGDISRTNGAIRQLLGTFKRWNYVAFTATPFANVLITNDQESIRKDYGNDLFPKDFIYWLSSGRVSEKYFGLEEMLSNSGKYVVEIDGDSISDPGDITELCSEFKDAVCYYIIANVICRAEKSIEQTTLLFNLSSKTSEHYKLRNLVESYIQQLRNEIGLRVWNGESYSTSEIYKRMHSVFVNRLADKGERYWEETILPGLEEASRIGVVTLNAGSSQQLDYDANPHIAVIGGFKISRGLTLKNLLVSVLGRHTTTMDTLLQMGRWFGYRRKIVDLLKVYMTSRNLIAFSNIEESIRDLRAQILEMKLENLNPSDYGIEVNYYIDSLGRIMPTGKNKMGKVQVMDTVREGYYLGKIRDSAKLPADIKEIDRNNDLILQFLENVQGWTEPRSERQFFASYNIPVEQLISLLEQVRFYGKFFNIEESAAILRDLLKGTQFDVMLHIKKNPSGRGFPINLGGKSYDVHLSERSMYYVPDSDGKGHLEIGREKSRVGDVRDIEQLSPLWVIQRVKEANKEGSPNEYLLEGRNVFFAVYPLLPITDGVPDRVDDLVYTVAAAKEAGDIVRRTKLGYVLAVSLGIPKISDFNGHEARRTLVNPDYIRRGVEE